MTLQQRLDRAARRGKLSTADLAVWFALPYQTVRSYRQRGSVPRRARRLRVQLRLQRLERAIHDQRFPVPVNVRSRRSYLLKIGQQMRRQR